MLAIRCHPEGTPLTFAEVPPWMAIVANNTSPADEEGLLTVTFVVVTCVDDAVVKAPDVIAANATALKAKTAPPITVETKRRCERANDIKEPLLNKETARFLIKMKN